jgi:hypothetical protein
MDWQTHVILAAKLLRTCDCDVGAAIYSNLPAIDSKPAHFHRVYAHILANQPKILDAGIEIFSGKKTGVDKNSYEYLRIKEEEAKFRELIEKAKDIIKSDEVTNVTNDKISAALSLISHLYFDMFNNPVQAFLPSTSFSSAQWAFWDKIDYMKFRNEFYEDGVIDSFRKNIAKSEIWDTKLDPIAMIKTMIIRIGEMGMPGISYTLIDETVADFIRYLLGEDYKGHISIAESYPFCIKLEKEIIKAIEESLEKN